jgi:hypothetical protein
MGCVVSFLSTLASWVQILLGTRTYACIFLCSALFAIDRGFIQEDLPIAYTYNPEICIRQSLVQHWLSLTHTNAIYRFVTMVY